MTTRRDLLIALGAGALAHPLPSFAQQQGKVWRIGFLWDSEQSDLYFKRLDTFKAAMRELGYVEGKNLVLEGRFAEGKIERLPALASELVNLKVDVFVTSSTPVTRVLQKATTTIPIVMVNLGDPVSSGLVKSLARPGGNITGFTGITAEISPKLLEMLLGMAPNLSRVAVLVSPANPATFVENIQSAARKTSIKILPVEVRTRQEIGNAFSLMTKDKIQAFIMATNQVFNSQFRQIAELALKHRLPSVHQSREYAEAGGLMSYGANTNDQYRRAATHVDKIFKGTKPADLPVEQPTSFELVINGRTAKALGLKIPQSLLISADKVIE